MVYTGRCPDYREGKSDLKLHVCCVDFRCTGPLAVNAWLPGLHHDARDGKTRYTLVRDS
jgi:hypothetical protein